MSFIEWAILLCILADCAFQWRTGNRLRVVEQEIVRAREHARVAELHAHAAHMYVRRPGVVTAVESNAASAAAESRS